MCGIAGVIQPSDQAPLDPALLRRMNETLRRRGPDDEGYWQGAQAALAMRRLSIIDLEGGHQPLCNEDRTVWTVFNGEIYNFQELRRYLLAKGHKFQTSSDTEVIVHLYEEKGEAFVRDLRGMFAIALWDAKASRFFLYRDRAGIKPLFYWFQEGVLAFASELKALLEFPQVQTRISIQALSDYLSFLYIPSPGTIYRDVHKLAPGHYLSYHEGEIELRCYWSWPEASPESMSETAWCDRILGEVEESVRLHRISDVPVGAFLSGGLDSSAVLALMARQSKTPVKTYSIGFDDPRYNELPYAREVARKFGSDHHEEIVSAAALDLLPEVIAGFDEPFADASSIPTFLVSRFARKDVKVCLSGDGGDELFGGYLWTRKEAWLAGYRRLPQSVRRLLERSFAISSEPNREKGFRQTLRRFLYDGSCSPERSFARRVTAVSESRKHGLFQDWVHAELEDHSSLRGLEGIFKGRDPVAAALRFDATVYLPDDILTKVDRMSMRHSLEVRVPLLDHKVIEMAAKIPASLKFKGRTTKYIFRKALKKILPPSITAQRKQGFSPPLERWFRGDFLKHARGLLLGEGAASLSYFRPESLRSILEEHAAGRQRFGHPIFALMVFELWARSRRGEPVGLGAGGRIP